MVILCRGCNQSKLNYAKRLCLTCYHREYGRKRRGHLDKNLLDTVTCCVPRCDAIASSPPGTLLMCADHHEEHYHTEGGYAYDRSSCQCGRSIRSTLLSNKSILDTSAPSTGIPGRTDSDG